MRWHLCVAFVVVLGACSSTAPPDCPGDHGDCRARCGYGEGDLATLTLGDFRRLGNKIPIDHIVLVMQENRTFDHYFSSLTIPGQTIEVAPPDATNPDPQDPGGTVSRFHQTDYCFDNPAESWDQIHREINGGKLDAFTTENALDDPINDLYGRRTMGYYDETDLPYYYALARAFAISDRHFSSVLANTWTNRLFYMAGTSLGVTSNVFPPQSNVLGFTPQNLFTRLNDAKVTWNFYVDDFPTIAILGETWTKNLSHIQPFSQFFDDAAAGKLASVTFVEGSDMQGALSPDEDPPGDMQVGQAMVAKVIAATTSAPTWPSTALFFSFDEQGGLYDHVPPPSACVPDDIPPQLGPSSVEAAFDQYGLRIPLIVVSPYAKRGYVSHEVTDHTSLLRFVEARFDLPALTHRDANAVPPFDMFDFDHPNLSVPDLPEAVIDQAQASACALKYPAKT